MTYKNDVMEQRNLEALMARGRSERSKVLHGFLRSAARAVGRFFGGQRRHQKGLGAGTA
ncbi:MAG: hypothetical protein RJQ21_15480 [Rhodospirillales bacterium]